MLSNWPVWSHSTAVPSMRLVSSVSPSKPPLPSELPPNWNRLIRLLEDGMASLLRLLVRGSRWEEVVEPIQRHSESYMSRTCNFAKLKTRYGLLIV